MVSVVWCYKQFKRFQQELEALRDSHHKELDQLYKDHYNFTQMYIEEHEKVRMEMNELTAVYCDLDQKHVEEMDRIHVHYAQEINKIKPDELLFDDCFSLKNATLENLYDALEIVMNHKIQLPLEKDHLIKMYLTEIYRRGMWVDTLEWWKYDQVICIACNKKPGESDCAVCLPNTQMPPEEYAIQHEMIVEMQWHEMRRKLKPILKERRDQLKQLKQHALTLM
jgi:hypothetical protein